MSRSRFDRLEPAKRNALLEVAAAEFAEKGFDGASLNRILDGAGMGKSSFYYYFDDKADLFATLTERAIADLFARVGPFDLAALTAETFWAACEMYYGRCIGVASSDASYAQLGRIFYRLRSDPRQAGPTDRIFDAVRDWGGAFLARGQALGVIRVDLPDSLLLDCMMAMAEALDRWVVAHWAELGDDALSRLAHEQVDLMRRLLAP